MATTTRNPAAGLSTADLERIRETLASGRKPKVVFTEQAGQVVGQTGQVVRLTDGEDSDEWLVVRFGHDELPFSPVDLALPARNGANGKRARSLPLPTPRKEEPVPDQPPTAAPSAPRRAGKPAKSDKPAAAASVARPATAAKAAKPASRSAKARQRTPSELTVTVAYQGGEWTVAAHQGSRVLAKPCLVKSAEALKLVAMLDVPGVHEAVEQVVAAERATAEERADQLRAQLAEVEARLAELRQVG